MRAILLTTLLLAALLAGCSSKPADTASHTTAAAGSAADFVTPGTWAVSNATERMFAWAHNGGSTPVKGTWSLTLAGGAPLPAGWTATFQPATFTLAPAGTKAGDARPTYPDWAPTLVTLHIAGNASAGPVQAELHAGSIVKAETLQVAAAMAKVSGPGSRVDVHYDGKFDDGTRFDQGDFPTTLGSGKTVLGFDEGLMGLAVGEVAVLHIPPAFAYGYDNPQGSGYEQFNGKTLVFTVALKSIA
jgi:hypothetical protein